MNKFEFVINNEANYLAYLEVERYEQSQKNKSRKNHTGRQAAGARKDR